jgi:uncharacterized protein (DUF488 family)
MFLPSQKETPVHPLYTLGYRAWTLPAFVACVDALGAVVADIRFMPQSRRYPFWRQRALQRTLGGRYHYIHALGNANYKGGPVEIVDLETGLTTVARLLEASPVILLCGCPELTRCHRRLVAEAFTAQSGQPVTHLEPPTEPLALFPESGE